MDTSDRYQSMGKVIIYSSIEEKNKLEAEMMPKISSKKRKEAALAIMNFLSAKVSRKRKRSHKK